MRVELSHLSMAFDGTEVLRDITFDEEVSALAVIGPSGGGKSTLLRIIGGLLVPTGGTLAVDGAPVPTGEAALRDYRATLGFVFQDGGLFHHLTAQENVALPLRVVHGVEDAEASDRAHDLLERLGLADSAAKRPAQLSGGQKQRVAIAGVIAMRPDCLVMDESTAMLDPHGRAQVMKTIRQLRAAGITIVSITHYMEEAAQADRVLVMSRGRIVMEGTPEQVFSQTERLHGYHLDVPQAAELRDELVKAGIPMPENVITPDACAEELYKLLK